MIFEWNPNKAKANIKKHKISFEEASSAFGDNFSISFHDKEHSVDEERFILIGTSFNGKLLVVTYTENNSKIRIISARKVTKKERAFYEK